MKSGDKASELKVAQLSTKIAEKLGYHYGEDNLCETVVNMVQEYVGTNNLPLLSPDGNFGTRNLKSNYAKPRYSFTRPNKYFNLIFKIEDEPLFEYVIDDDQTCEPRTLLPIIPLQLLNGSKVIVTAYSTTIPNYDTSKIRRWMFENLLK